MTHLENFARSAAKSYLQNIVFVDDEIYSKSSGHPASVSSELPLFKSPFAGAEAQSSSPGNDNAESAKIPYHPKQLVESFAREGMVCALYEPAEDFNSEPTSELFKLCERADVVILDWDLFGQNGLNILPLVGNLVNQSQSSHPHHSRLCVIYTAKPDLSRVASAIYEHLRKANLAVEDVTDSTTLIAGATRIIVLGKPNVPGRTEEIKALEISEDQLAGRVIDEFAKMHNGILTSYALHGLASVRQNSKKLLDKLHSDLDGTFLLHRALLIESEEAFEQIPELIAEEILAILLDNQVPADQVSQIAADAASKLKLQDVTWPPIDNKTAAEKEQLARTFLGAGAAAIAAQYEVRIDKKDRDLAKRLHNSMGCAQTNAEKKLASLFSLRTNYFETQQPNLSFGTIVRWRDDRVDEKPFMYALCLMPICDSVRLKVGGENKTSFPFWTLKTANSGGSSRGIVVPTNEGTYVELYASGKPRDMLWICGFSPAESGMVCSKKDGPIFFFSGDEKDRLEWVAQLKPAHAQRVAHDIGQSFSRVGVVEAEWLRLITEGRLS